MIYTLLLIGAAIAIAVLTWRWLRNELRHAAAWLSEKLLLMRGGETPERLLEDARGVFDERGLTPHFILVSSQVAAFYGPLRRRHVGPRSEAPLPVAVTLALGADVDAGVLYLRSVIAGRDGVGRETRELLGFDEIERIEHTPHGLPADITPVADTALEILAGGGRPRYHMALEPEWAVAPGDVVDRVRALVEQRHRPEAAPVIVR